MEKVVKTVNVYDKNCIGCKRYGLPVMVTFMPVEEGDIFHDWFLSTGQAKELHHRLGEVLKRNETGGERIVIMNNKPIPAGAKKIANYIKKNVRRPSVKTADFSCGMIVWFRKSVNDYCCPMGLMKETNESFPFSDSHFNSVFLKDNKKVFSNDNIDAFIGWWDDQTDVEFAVNQVWGKKK